MDRDRNLRFVNQAARRLLGYAEQDVIAGRCRLTTGGLDCDEACPLSWALERDTEVVRDFAAVYRTKAGDPVALRVTIIPLRAADGAFSGALEILRPSEPVLGFTLAGASAAAVALRRRVMALARSAAPLVIVGDRVECRDLARAVHRAAGLPDALFRDAPAVGEPWPPGTMFHDRAEAPVEVPPGWRLIRARPRGSVAEPDHEVLVAPPLDQRRQDLPLMVAEWAGELDPRLRLTAEATERLVQALLERGVDAFADILATAVAGAHAAGELRPEHIWPGSEPSTLVDELLDESDPLTSLEGRVLGEVLERCGWRMQEAADRLGMSRVTLWRKLREHGIQRPGSE